MIYLNHAGTSWPKPQSVLKAVEEFNYCSPSEWTDRFDDAIKHVRHFFGLSNDDYFLPTTSCTSAISLVMSNMSWNKGDRLIMSGMEHHAMSRWFYKLQLVQGVECSLIPRTKGSPLDLDFLESQMQKGVSVVALSMISNVTGELMPYKEVLELSKQYGVMCFLDGAQAAGVIPIDLKTLAPDIFVFAGHKGPQAIHGIGGLYLSDRVSMACPTASCSLDRLEKNSLSLPSYCDAGSVNMPALVSLAAGIKHLDDNDLNQLLERRKNKMTRFVEQLKSIHGLTVYGNTDLIMYTAVSITHEHYSSGEISNRLSEDFNIKAGAGFQCAPVTHETMGTANEGTLRFSIGNTTTTEELDQTVDALKSILS